MNQLKVGDTVWVIGSFKPAQVTVVYVGKKQACLAFQDGRLRCDEPTAIFQTREACLEALVERLREDAALWRNMNLGGPGTITERTYS